MSSTDAQTVVIADYDYGDVSIGRAIIEGAGLKLVAEHAMALLLASARKICQYDQATRAGTWRWQTGYPIHRLRGSVLGLLSFEAIAQAIAIRAGGFGIAVSARGLWRGLWPCNPV